MAPIAVDPDKVRSFADKDAFRAWLADELAGETGGRVTTADA